jgi:hypothetical protein
MSQGQNHPRKWAIGAICCYLVVLLTNGCNSLNPFAICNFGGPTHREAAYPLVFTDGPKKGKDVEVALFISIAPGPGPELARCDVKLANDIARILPEMAKENKQKITVLDQVVVNKLQLKNPNWKLIHGSERGRALGVDFVLDISVDKMSFYQPGSQNQFFEGHAEVNVEVYEVDAGPVEPKYHYVYEFKYPYPGMMDTVRPPFTRFKQESLEHLALELCKQHFQHKKDD